MIDPLDHSDEPDGEPQSRQNGFSSGLLTVPFHSTRRHHQNRDARWYQEIAVSLCTGYAVSILNVPVCKTFNLLLKDF